MKWKYILPAGLLACAMLNVQNVYAQDPITFTDENGEKVSYGEQKEWTRTIEYVFPDDSGRNHTVYQTTTGNEVWITAQNGAVEYHIGNNGECGWESVSTPYVEGYTADIQMIPDVDLYWHPDQVRNDHVIVTYTPVITETESPTVTATPVPEQAKESEAPSSSKETKSVEETPTPQQSEEPIEMVKEEAEESGINWAVPGALAIAGGIGVAAYFVIRKLNISDDEEDE
ncbi:mucin-binding protein [Anaerolactibacter massiliensis]|uniref:mucin-binding protein n=1 Tax=Anaerolactibacter massiliensis TaxID=2044573 RepID=UPI00107FB0FD|nr:hypothetical protein [Anaerolactibacter massiliensis]